MSYKAEKRGCPEKTGISVDLRKRIVDAVDKGDSTQLQIARRFAVSLGFVKKLLSQRKRTGSIENLHHHAGRKQCITPEQQRAIRAHLAKNPGATLAEIKTAVALACSLTSIFRTLRRMRMTYKKKRSGPPNRTVRKSGNRGRAGSKNAWNGSRHTSCSSTKPPQRPN